MHQETFFYNIDDAAIDFGLYYNGASINLNIEFGSTIYMITNKKGKIGFTYSWQIEVKMVM